MAEKKETTAKAAPKKAAAPKKVVKKVEVAVNAENVGFRAGDVYNALAVSEKALTVAEIAKRVGVDGTDAFISLDGLNEKQVISAANKYTIFGAYRNNTAS